MFFVKIIEDTLAEVQKYSENDLRKPLKVHFMNEEGLDEGELRKEFFMRHNSEIFDEYWGIFKELDDSRRSWLSEYSDDMPPRLFEMVGLMIGLAIYNFQITNLPLPLAFSKKLLHEPVELSDLEEFMPTQYNSLRNVLDYTDDDLEKVYCLTFEILRNGPNGLENVALKENGRQINVNQTNK